MLQISFAPAILPAKGVLALLAREEAPPTGLHRQLDQATAGRLSAAQAAAEFAGKKAEHCSVLAPGAGLDRVLLLGVGDAPDAAVLERAGGRAAAALAREDAPAIAADGLDAGSCARLALGAVLRAYRFDRYRTTEKAEEKPRLAALSVLCDDPAAAQAAWDGLRPVADGVILARDLVSEPPNVLTPAEMATRCEALRALGVEVTVMLPDELAAQGFGALLAVARGSAQEARVVVMRWRGSDAGPVAFVGKGVTFDSGGISIKPSAGMEEMKFDMAGAGAVIGAMAAIAGRRARLHVLGVVGLVENMPSGTAQRPGDVVATCSGQTVEIINTDAEGRLVLADVLWWTQKTHGPRCLIDLATLTGAMVISLGHEYAGVFGSEDALTAQLVEAGRASGDKLWRLPLHAGYDKQIDSDIADVKNAGPRPAGSITAAHFLKRFTNGLPWAHLDIAGTAWASKDAALCPKGATGFGVRLLNDWAAGQEDGPGN